MRLIATRIPARSWQVAIWTGLPPGYIDEGQPIDTVCNILHMNPDECMVTHAMGDLSDEVNVAIGMEAIRHGYKFMHYAVAAGTKSSHRAVYQKTVQGMDWYMVDLLAEAEKLTNGDIYGRR
jgi:hypothetical protein